MQTNGASRSRRWVPLVDIALVGALIVADMRGLIPFSKTPFLLALAWLSLRLRGARWSQLGLAPRADWKRLVIVGCGAGVVFEMLSVWFHQPLVEQWLGKPADLSEFRFMIGNLPALLAILALNWILAAFGEELGWRGYVTERWAAVAGGGRGSWWVATLATSVLFGFAHDYQQATGQVVAAIDGLLLGMLFLTTGRNLIAPIVAHGVSNSIAFVMIYFGRYPGLS